MRILVLYGNQNLLDRTRLIFESHNHHWVFLKDEDTDFTEMPEIGYDIIFSLHCKKIFPSWLVKSIRCINIHPGYNPYNRGMFPHVWSIINGYPAGVTIHEMDEKIDHGKILCQQRVEVSLYDTSETLYNRIIDTEVQLLQLRLGDILADNIEAFEPISEGNYNSLEDFKKLCEVDFARHGESYNLLRALTHGEYKNAKLGTRYLKLQII